MSNDERLARGGGQPRRGPALPARVAALPENERSRERLQRLDSGALTTAELLAIVLRPGSAREDVHAVAGRLLAEYGGLRGLATADLPTLVEIHGLRPAKRHRRSPLSSNSAAVPRSRANCCAHARTARRTSRGCCSRKRCACSSSIPSTTCLPNQRSTEAQSTPHQPES